MPSQEPTRIMVTGAGAPGIAGTIWALRNNPENSPVWLMGVDARDAAVGRYLADDFALIPNATDAEFVERLRRVGVERGVEALLPQVTAELEPLAASVPILETAGISTVISPLTAIVDANDKYTILQLATKTGVPCPRYRLVSNSAELMAAAHEFGYPKTPFVVKPRNSNGQRGFRIVTGEGLTTERFLTEKPSGFEVSLEYLCDVFSRDRWPELLATEYLPGPEYSVDVFVGEQFQIAVPRVRTEIRSGISFRTRVELRKDLMDWSLLLAEKLGLRFAVGFQFKINSDGTPCLLECNPRIQGSMVASVFSGFNFMHYSVREAMGVPVKPSEVGRLEEVEMVRYWGGIATDGCGNATSRI